MWERMNYGDMNDKQKLELMIRTISRMSCPGRYGSFDKCKESGCFGGGNTCSLHMLLDLQMLKVREDMLMRAEARNLAHLRKENKALKRKLAALEKLIKEPIEIKEEDGEE